MGCWFRVEQHHLAHCNLKSVIDELRVILKFHQRDVGNSTGDFTDNRAAQDRMVNLYIFAWKSMKGYCHKRLIVTILNKNSTCRKQICRGNHNVWVKNGVHNPKCCVGMRLSAFTEVYSTSQSSEEPLVSGRWLGKNSRVWESIKITGNYNTY